MVLSVAIDCLHTVKWFQLVDFIIRYTYIFQSFFYFSGKAEVYIYIYISVAIYYFLTVKWFQVMYFIVCTPSFSRVSFSFLARLKYIYIYIYI